MESNVYDDLKTHDAMDKNSMERKGKQSKSIYSIRKACRNEWLGIKPGVDHSILVELDNLDFKVFQDF